jgi:hypothetical protein
MIDDAAQVLVNRFIQHFAFQRFIGLFFVLGLRYIRQHRRRQADREHQIPPCRTLHVCFSFPKIDLLRS